MALLCPSGVVRARQCARHRNSICCRPYSPDTHPEDDDGFLPEVLEPRPCRLAHVLFAMESVQASPQMVKNFRHTLVSTMEILWESLRARESQIFGATYAEGNTHHHRLMGSLKSYPSYHH